LRASSYNNIIFREIADFVAHNDKRDRGLTNQSLEAMYYSLKYFLEYTSPKISLDIAKPFPIWIKKLIKYQVDKIDEEKLREKFSVGKERLKTRIDKGFKDDNQTNGEKRGQDTFITIFSFSLAVLYHLALRADPVAQRSATATPLRPAVTGG